MIPLSFCYRKSNSPMKYPKPQEATFSMPRYGKRKLPDDYTDSLGHNKRERVCSEAHYSSTTAEPKDSCNDKRFLSETHFSTAKKSSRADLKCSKSGSDECHRKEAKRGRTMDRCTRLQCWAILKRLMIHPDGVAFKKTEYSDPNSDHCDSETKKAIMGLEAIQWKLNKGMCLKADEFADDVRVMFSDVMLYGPNIRGIHRTAMKLREEFEKRWESMKERWASDMENNGENKSKKRDSTREKCTEVAPISQYHNRVSHKLEPSKAAQVGKNGGLIALNDEDICPSFLGQSYSTDCASQEEIKKLTYFSKSKKTQTANNVGTNTRSLCRPKSASVLRKSDTDSSDGVTIAVNDEDCGSQKEFKKRNYFSRADSEKKEKEKEAQKRTGRIKKEREAARVALLEMKKTVEIGDDMKQYEDLLQLLYHHNSPMSWYSLKSLGLYLKD